MGVLPTMEGSVLSRRERNRSLTHRRLGAATGVHIRLFNPHVSSIIGEKCPEELAKLSNVIRDNRARLGSMREKITPTKVLPTPSSHGTNPTSLSISAIRLGDHQYQSPFHDSASNKREIHAIQPSTKKLGKLATRYTKFRAFTVEGLLVRGS